MPVYEFYFKSCTLFDFFCRIVNTEKRPLCPQCAKMTLQRFVSRFSGTAVMSRIFDTVRMRYFTICSTL